MQPSYTEKTLPHRGHRSEEPENRWRSREYHNRRVVYSESKTIESAAMRRKDIAEQGRAGNPDLQITRARRHRAPASKKRTRSSKTCAWSWCTAKSCRCSEPA